MRVLACTSTKHHCPSGGEGNPASSPRCSRTRSSWTGWQGWRWIWRCRTPTSNLSRQTCPAWRVCWGLSGTESKLGCPFLSLWVGRSTLPRFLCPTCLHGLWTPAPNHGWGSISTWKSKAPKLIPMLSTDYRRLTGFIFCAKFRIRFYNVQMICIRIWNGKFQFWNKTGAL